MTRLLALLLTLYLGTPVFADDYKISIADASGITAARNAYCAAQAQDAPCAITSDGEYVQMVMQSAADSYVRQYDTAGAKKADFLATLPEKKRLAVEAELSK